MEKGNRVREWNMRDERDDGAERRSDGSRHALHCKSLSRGKAIRELASMSNSHKFAPSAVKNKQKREQVFHKAKKEKGQAKLQRRLANAKREADDPKAKQVRSLFPSRHTANYVLLPKTVETTGGECSPHARKYARV
jgi:hypothetical protein